MGKLADLKAAQGEKIRQVTELADAAEKAGREFTADERETVTRLMNEAKATRGEFDKLKADADMLAEVKNLGIALDGDEAGKGQGGQLFDSASGLIVPGANGKTLGEQFVSSPQMATLLKQHNGQVNDRARVMGDPVGVKDLMGLDASAHAKALVTGASGTSAGALINNDLLGLRDPASSFMRPLVIRNLITTGTTQSDTVEYARVTGFTNAAAPVAESTATADPGTMNAAGGVKPESTLALDVVTAPVRTIAHWIPATKRALSDAGQLRALIDAFLRYGLDEELEDQIVNGDGVGQNFTGISNVAGVQAQAFATDILTTLRRARTKVRTVGRAIPTAFVMNPSDWEAIDLLQDNEGRYYYGGPADVGQPRIWGLPVVESEAVVAGTAYVGDWRQAFLLDREQSAITVSDSHANFFIRNMVAILAELRAVFGVFRPVAFVEIALA